MVMMSGPPTDKYHLTMLATETSLKARQWEPRLRKEKAFEERFHVGRANSMLFFWSLKLVP